MHANVDKYSKFVGTKPEMVKKSLILSLLISIFSILACSKKHESIAKADILFPDSLTTGGISDDTLDEFEYEADSLEVDDSEK